VSHWEFLDVRLFYHYHFYHALILPVGKISNSLEECIFDNIALYFEC